MGDNTLWGPNSRAIIFVSMSSAALVAPGKKGHKTTKAYLISVIKTIPLSVSTGLKKNNYFQYSIRQNNNVNK